MMNLSLFILILISSILDNTFIFLLSISYILLLSLVKLFPFFMILLSSKVLKLFVLDIEFGCIGIIVVYFLSLLYEIILL